MKLAIFGATGATGKYVVSQALAAGHELKVLARNPAKLGDAASKVEVIKGGIEDQAAVNQTVEGVDAVISVIGHGTKSPANLLTMGITNIIAAMKANGVRRVISLTGAGVLTEGDKPAFMDRVMTVMLKIFAGTVLQDGINHKNALVASGLDWTIVRGPLLTNGKHSEYIVGHVGDKGMDFRAPRADVAEFMLHLAVSDEHIGEMPMIASRK